MTRTGFRFCLRVLLTCISVTTFATQVFAFPGELDTTFGNNGVYVYQTGLNGSSVFSSVIQPDGRIVLAGYSSDTANSVPTLYFPTLERLLPNGAPDPSFGSGGAIRFSFSGQFQSIALQPDGKLVMVGYTKETGSNQYLLVRCNADGSLDTTFGGTGKITAQFVADATSSFGREVLIRPNGRILVVGYSNSSTGINFSAAQYTDSGVLDLDFGTSGTTVVPNTDFAEAATLQPDGKIIIVDRHLLTRLHPNGAVDTSFGNNGTMNVHPGIGGLFVSIQALKVQPDGKILAAGYSTFKWTNIFLLRLNPNGALDSSFTPSGTTVQGPGNGRGLDLDLQPDGKIVVIGVAFTSPAQYTINRYRTDGTSDPGFGTNGRTITNFPYSVGGSAMTVRIQPDGKIVVASGGLPNNTPSHVAIRLKGDGRAATVRFDFDGDGKTDVSTFRPSDTNWHLLRSGSGSTSIQWGLATDTLIPADYDGDGKTNVAVYRNGAWKILWSDGTYHQTVFGLSEDLPRPGDFDGDGRADIAIWRPSTGYWYWLKSSTGQLDATQFGTAGDLPLIADFDGDGKSEKAVFRPSNGNWYYLRSTDGQYTAIHFGTAGDIPIVGDFDGDGKTDLSVFRPSNNYWYRINSSNGQYSATPFGTSGDIPVAGDYDGDNRTDIAVFRPSNKVWYLLNSSTGYTGIQYGAAGDRPLPAAYGP